MICNIAQASPTLHVHELYRNEQSKTENKPNRVQVSNMKNTEFTNQLVEFTGGCRPGNQTLCLQTLIIYNTALL